MQADHACVNVRYRAEHGWAESTDARPRIISSQLQGWGQWAKEVRPKLSRAERHMCAGLDDVPFAGAYDRAEIAGVPFACEKIQQKAKSKTCTVMVRASGGQLVIGQVRMFLKWIPPWGTSGGDALEIADVQWYGAKGRNARLFNAPQVSKAFQNDPAGNLCMVEEIIPSHVCLVPHLHHSDQWQVLHSRLPIEPSEGV